MKNCYFLAFTLLAFLFSKNVATAQTAAAMAKPEIYLRSGLHLSAWDNSGGHLVGVEGHYPFFEQMGIFSNWSFGKNYFSTLIEEFGKAKPENLRTFSSKIGLTWLTKKGHSRWSWGAARQFLPKPTKRHSFEYVPRDFIGMTPDQILEYQEMLKKRNKSKSLYGFSAGYERLFRWGGRVKGSFGFDAQVFYTQPVMWYDDSWSMSLVFSLGAGF